MKTECGIIRDLLPVYAEKMTSDASTAAVEEHLKECEKCRELLESMKAPNAEILFNTEADQMFQNYVKARNRKTRLKMAALVAIGLVIARIVQLLPVIFATGLGIFGFGSPDIHVDSDIANYGDYIGKKAIKPYDNKWNMREEIFPEKITEKMKVEDYKMVYYDPWDAQWLSYLVVEYNDEDYRKELERLHTYKSTKYLGYYGTTGFDNDYELAAIEADSYYGFVYALDAHNGKIVYVEIIFCNYQMDLYYPEYIPTDYLPEGFDATDNNPYRQSHI